MRYVRANRDYVGLSFDSESSAWSGKTIASSGTRLNFRGYGDVSSVAQNASGIDITLRKISTYMFSTSRHLVVTISQTIIVMLFVIS